MKILFATQVMLDRPYGGARHVTAVARAFAELGHEVILVAPGNDAAQGVTRVRPPRWLKPGMRMESVLAALATRAAIDHRPDVAYVRISATSSLIPVALAALRIPIVLELNGRILDELRELGRGATAVRAVQLALTRVVKLSRALVAVEPRIGRHAELELAATRVVVIENGADLSVATPGDRRDARARLELDPARRFIAFTGTLVPELRLDLLLEAQHALDGVVLLIAGDGPQAALLGDAARRAPDAILHLGVVPHETAVLALRAADVCVNVRDGDLGMKCLEYAAVGRRFATFRVEGTERFEALYPGLEAVHLVDERSASGLANALEAALEAEARLGPLPLEAVANARSTLGWDHTARRIAEVLASCA